MALSSGKFRQTRVKRQCLGRVFCDLMHCYVEPGARASLHDFTREQSLCKCSENSEISYKFIFASISLLLEV